MNIVATTLALAISVPDVWNSWAPREEIQPRFFAETDSETNEMVLGLHGLDREAVDGAWVRTYAVQANSHVRFSALRKTTTVTAPRRSAVVKITWQDDQGVQIRHQGDIVPPEYPMDARGVPDSWTEVADTYRVPVGATQARVELRLRWSTGSVRWKRASLLPVDEPTPRLVKLAAIHLQPKLGSTPEEKCTQFAPLISEAAAQGADLVCLPESLTYYRSGRTMADCAESIPGPSSDYFAKLAQQHNLYIVAGLTEREGTIVYNTAVLLGPDGTLLGKYRKVCLPREEIEAGLTPGSDYPVFDTRFGRVGMMICWDVHFPEVARHLSSRGAEVIAMPIWGGNPTLAQARAIENQIYLVSSTYTSLEAGAMVSGIWDHRGELLARNGAKWGQLLVAEVDLDARTQWPWLGDLKARIPRERPLDGFEQ